MDFTTRSKRPVFPVPSIHHQTLLSKSIFEHLVFVPSVAVIALASKSIQNSSLSANFACNVIIDRITIPLFRTVFHPRSSLPLQFTPKFSLHLPWISPTGTQHWKSFVSDVFLPFVDALRKSKYFFKSVTDLEIHEVGNFFQNLLLAGGDNAETLSRLERFKVSGSQRTPEDVALYNHPLLLKSKTLKEFEFFSFGWLQDEWLESTIGKCPLLTTLAAPRASCSEVTNENGWAHLSNLVHLTKLDLNLCNTSISNRTCAYFAHLFNITDLNLNAVFEVDQEGFKHLAGLTRMKILNVGFTGVCDICLEQHFANMNDLEYLDLSETRRISDRGLQALAKNQKKLKTLSLRCSCSSELKFEIFLPQQIADSSSAESLLFPNLSDLNLSENSKISILGFQQLCVYSSKRMETLNLSRTKLTNNHFAQVLLPSPTQPHKPSTFLRLVKHIDLASAKIDDSILFILAQALKSCETLKLSGIATITFTFFVVMKKSSANDSSSSSKNDAGANDNDERSAKLFPNLEKLDISGSQNISLIGYRVIGCFRKLICLDVSGSSFTNRHLESLASVAQGKLEHLIAAYSSLDDAGILENVPKMKSLRKINVRDCRGVQAGRSELESRLNGVVVVDKME